ncbi:uncharacterized protein LOC108716578 [Xenopus laevis]|uniref:Uncharacterized protein n=2 Tax=Xenopus laevis TaxID=8355 RepID=A0A974HIT6_XENLA|nr:uncharacterized protein LOC108716578 [Xenopus laevis]OCT79667.1 hypothetical protein XELAEV_18026475mg [Xenopus laevis]
MYHFCLVLRQQIEELQESREVEDFCRGDITEIGMMEEQQQSNAQETIIDTLIEEEFATGSLPRQVAPESVSATNTGGRRRSSGPFARRRRIPSRASIQTRQHMTQFINLAKTCMSVEKKRWKHLSRHFTQMHNLQELSMERYNILIDACKETNTILKHFADSIQGRPTSSTCASG